MSSVPQTLDPKEVAATLQADDTVLLLDVREDDERETASLGGTHIPLRQLPLRHKELPRDRRIVVYCHHGMRSAQATAFLASVGITATNMRGGIDAWSQQVDATIPRY